MFTEWENEYERIIRGLHGVNPNIAAQKVSLEDAHPL